MHISNFCTNDPQKKSTQLENCRKNYSDKIATLLVVTFPAAFFTKAITKFFQQKTRLKTCVTVATSI